MSSDPTHMIGGGFPTLSNACLSLTTCGRSLQKFIDRSDQNQSGDLTLAEFVHYVIEHEKKLRLVFSSLDHNKDGELTGQSWFRPGGGEVMNTGVWVLGADILALG